MAARQRPAVTAAATLVSACLAHLVVVGGSTALFNDTFSTNGGWALTAVGASKYDACSTQLPDTRDSVSAPASASVRSVASCKGLSQNVTASLQRTVDLGQVTAGETFLLTFKMRPSISTPAKAACGATHPVLEGWAGVRANGVRSRGTPLELDPCYEGATSKTYSWSEGRMCFTYGTPPPAEQAPVTLPSTSLMVELIAEAYGGSGNCNAAVEGWFDDLSIQRPDPFVVTWPADVSVPGCPPFSRLRIMGPTYSGGCPPQVSYTDATLVAGCPYKRARTWTVVHMGVAAQHVQTIEATGGRPRPPRPSPPEPSG